VTVGNPAATVRKAVGNLAAVVHKVGMDTVAVVAHRVETNIAIEADYRVAGMDTALEVDWMIADIVVED